MLILIKSFLESKNVFWEQPKYTLEWVPDCIVGRDNTLGRQPKYTPEWVPDHVLYFYAHVGTIAHMLDPFFFGKYGCIEKKQIQGECKSLPNYPKQQSP